MLTVKIENLKQFNVVIKSNKVNAIILPTDCFSYNEIIKLINKIKNNNKKAFVLFERISRYAEIKFLCNESINILNIKNLDGAIIQNLDCFNCILDNINDVENRNISIELNYTMNCYNKLSKNLYKEIYNKKRLNSNDYPLLFTAPLELNIYELSEVKYNTFVVYNYIDTMVSANCLYKNTVNDKSCKYRFNQENVNNYTSHIIDRKNKKLFYKTYCKYCYNKIFNVEPLYLLDKLDEIINKNVFEDNNNHNFRIDFTIENEKEVMDILSLKCPKYFTRFHYKKSIE